MPSHIKVYCDSNDAGKLWVRRRAGGYKKNKKRGLDAEDEHSAAKKPRGTEDAVHASIEKHQAWSNVLVRQS